jgi:L-alanine-DL-glutamate epimerase-like enolase superfamily enzyme
MIIERMDVKVMEAPLVTPFRIATGQHNTLKNVFVRLTLKGGIKGFGEAAVATHITGETVDGTLRNLKEAAAVSIGEDISDYRSFLSAFREKFADNHAGLAALEMAVLDAWTRTLKIPLWKLFGARTAPLRSDITVVIGSLEEAATFAAAYYRRGFKAFKVKVGKDHDLDLARVLAVKKAARGASIVLDANQGFDAKGMLRFLRELKKYKVVPVLVEQPVPKDDWDGLKQVTQALKGSGILVCADESVGSLASAARAVREKAVTAINVKLMKSGILEGEAIARLARAAGLELMIGAMMESSLAVTASAHMACGMGCFKFIDLDTTYFLKGALSKSPYLDGKGCFDLSCARPGIGVTVSL